MAKVGAQRAADLTGRSKSTIQRAMNAGKLSFEQDSSGRRVIDVSELDRVFGIKPQKPQQPQQQVFSTSSMAAPSAVAAAPTYFSDEDGPNIDDIAQAVERERMVMTIKMLEQQLETASEALTDLKCQRDKWERQATQVMLTSQYAQRQADELRSQLKEREEKARLRRLQYEQKFAHLQQDEGKKGLLLGNLGSGAAKSASEPDSRSASALQQSQDQHQSRSRDNEKLDEQMKMLKAENQNARKSSSSVFRFWKKVSA